MIFRRAGHVELHRQAFFLVQERRGRDSYPDRLTISAITLLHYTAMTYVRSNPFRLMIAWAIKAGDSLIVAILSGGASAQNLIGSVLPARYSNRASSSSASMLSSGWF